jgi:hypothetical protein
MSPSEASSCAGSAIERILKRTLRSYGETAKLAPVAAESRIIFYYGVRSIPKPWSLVKMELDQHFGFPIVERVERANDYFRAKLYELLEAA